MELTWKSVAVFTQIRNFFSVLWIRDILVRIRLRRSIPLTSGSCVFCQWLTRCPQKKFYFNGFCFLLFEGTFTSVFIDIETKRSHKIVETKVFLTFLLVDGIRIRIWDARKLTDPDPQHWFFPESVLTSIFSYCSIFLSILGFTAFPSIYSPYFCFMYSDQPDTSFFGSIYKFHKFQERRQLFKFELAKTNRFSISLNPSLHI